MENRLRKVDRVVSTPTSFEGFFEVSRVGQETSDQGDQIVVRARIFLPADEREDSYYTNYLVRRHLCFGSRLKIGGEYLTPHWGKEITDKNGHRWHYREDYFRGTKWSDAFARAQAWAEGELNKLSEALAARAKALEIAED